MQQPLLLLQLLLFRLQQQEQQQPTAAGHMRGMSHVGAPSRLSLQVLLFLLMPRRVQPHLVAAPLQHQQEQLQCGVSLQLAAC